VALLGVVLALLALVMFGRLPGEGRWVADLANSAHGPAFAVVTLCLIALGRRVTTKPVGLLREYSRAVVTTLLLGALIELLQLVTGRDASFDDLLRDGLGALAATGFLAVADPEVHALPSCRSIRRSGLLVGIASTVIVMAPVALSGIAYLQRHRNFPVLADFGSPVSTYFFGVYSAATVQRRPVPLAMVGDGAEAQGLQVQLRGNERWGLALWEPCPDWRGYRRLALELANPTDAKLVLTIRIRDVSQRKKRQAGYFGTITLPPHSRQAWTVPLHELAAARGPAHVDIARVHSLVLTRHPANRAQQFYLVRIWLMRR
jgi:hypothetical protein